MTEQRVPDERDRTVAARPRRPEMERPPAPVSTAQLRPTMIDRGLGILRTGLAVGAIAIVTGFIWRSDAQTSLVATLEESAAAEAIRQQAADIVLYGSLGLMTLLIVIELLIASRIAAGSGVARLMLTLVIPVHVVVLYLLHEVAVQDTWYGTVIVACLIVQSLLSLLSLLLLWHPLSSRWLREIRSGPVRHSAAPES